MVATGPSMTGASGVVQGLGWLPTCEPVRYAHTSVAVPFDTSQPGARRLREWARRTSAELDPVTVEIRKPVLLLEATERCLLPGERATLTARAADRLIEEGSAVPLLT